MTKKALIAIGYPDGFIDISKELTGLIDTMKGKKLEVTIEEFLIWVSCIGGSTYENLMEKCTSQYGYDYKKIREIIEAYKTRKMLIEIDYEDPDQSFDNIKNLCPLKQGWGYGYKGNDYKVLLGKELVSLKQLQYYIWTECNGLNTIEKIAKTFKIDNGAIFVFIMGLFQEGLIFLTKKK